MIFRNAVGNTIPKSMSKLVIKQKLSYAFRTLLQQVLPGSTESLGIRVLKARGIFTESYWYWIGVGALAGYILLFNGVFTIALAYLNREYISCLAFSINQFFISSHYQSLNLEIEPLQHLVKFKQLYQKRSMTKNTLKKLVRVSNHL